MNEVILEFRRLQHAHGLARALLFSSYIDVFAGSPPMHIEELLALAAEHKFPMFLALALALRGQSLIALGQPQEGLALVMQALPRLRAMGHVSGTPSQFAALAKAHALLGQSDEAHNCLAEAARILKTTDERLHEVYVLHLVPGNLLQVAGDWSGAERHYRQAIVVAGRQSAKLFQLWAAISLARLWRDQGKSTEAHDLLAPIYGWFTEGFDAPVLKEAKALLDVLV